MCVTEIWSYRECGCFYNHKILCRTYRREQTLCFAQNIQYPVDKWLNEMAVAPDTSPQLFRPRAILVEPGDCPNHRVVEKSFLNQICEDCLLAELEGLPSSLDISATAQDFPTANSDNGEGLIWDSEVRIEIEDPDSEFSANPSVPEAAVRSQETPDEDWRILESHVEIIIEDEHHTIVAKSAASPEMVAHQRSGRSQPSLTENSQSNSHHGDLYQTNSGTSESKRYGRAFQKINVASFEDADTDSGIDLQCFHGDPQALSRGRALMCSNPHKGEVREADADSTPVPAKAKIGAKGLSKLQSLASLSMSLRVAPRSLMAVSDHCGDIRTVSECSSSSMGSSSKNPFRWKGSPRIGETSGSMFCGFEQLSSNIDGNILNPEAQDAPAVPLRNSSLKSFAHYLMECPTRTKAMMQPRAGSYLRSLTHSPTFSWLRKHAESSEETDSSTRVSGSRSETTFESASWASSLKTNSAGGLEGEKASMIPSIPKSSTMNTMRAIIEGCIDRDVGLDDQDEAVPQQPLLRK
ncbi:uncharacterized protein Z520_08300 [Fonsecaea multimorphosa CBS 102226]|uniref:Uncharacterized protein n=1 Tax=Fonsecaea multimorphosa CBS 102226 TaxID=1442371 RepID=A0A0D2H2F7_9EURO|nr:uncharacterized protein Z520_08300 [Fonsecaea multimorphosa CBS 102226]KIX96045.1 hypothetical protein Z520_08300 [Fonsecaea multimorphosa CBS 102226]OAL21812.1 hypothetical protein AYO22_07754 [Fonsecaea multimorphosa]